jgi:hypothetical protein
MLSGDKEMSKLGLKIGRVLVKKITGEDPITEEVFKAWVQLLWSSGNLQ